jgi:BMFP domain-containing protein YqiC
MTRDELLSEKRNIESSLAEISDRKRAAELEVLRTKMPARDEFSALKRLGIESRQEGSSLRIRLAEVNAALSTTKTSPDNTKLLEEVVSLLTQILNTMPKAETWQ